jgi:hypothetical protein
MRESARHSQLHYHPDGSAIVTYNGKNYYNRPLYCNKVWPVVYAGDKPRLVGLDWNGVFGHLDIAMQRRDVSVWLHDFQNITARYLPGRMQWLISDPRFVGLVITMEATTLASGVGFTVHLGSKGAQVQDKLLWHYGGYLIGWGLDGQTQIKKPANDAETPYDFTSQANGFEIQLINSSQYIDNPPPLCIIGQFSIPVEVKRVSSIVPVNPGDMLTITTQSSDKGVCVVSGISDKKAISLAVYVDSITDRPYSLYDAWIGSRHLTTADLDPSIRKFSETIKQSPTQTFTAGWKHATQIGRTVIVKTPDPYLDAQVGASCSAVYGLYVEPAFTHGGSQWRAQMPGWRMLDGATAYGWHGFVKDQAKYYIDRMIRSSNLVTPKANDAGTEEAFDSRYYGKGRIAIDQGNYNFQVQFFEELVRSWRHTGDEQLEAMLLPALELHLERARECFDPDDDGLYESYINTWPTDSVGYNGGGSVEESAYCYYMHIAAAEMCMRKKDQAGSDRHNTQAKKINNALHNLLWLKHKGYFASYIEQGGHHRVHDDAWLYSEFLPIDLGIATNAESIRALYYTEWGLERITLPYGGELCQTSNWVPSIWSVRELYGGDNYHLALSYFRMGLSDAGWQLLKGAATESGFGDLKPKTEYGGRTNMQSPGGLSHPSGSIDFSDITNMFCRCLVEGMFGYRPDYPNGLVHIQPSLPADWDHASIKTPDYQLNFKRVGEIDSYQIGLKNPAEMVLRLPVYAKHLVSATVNGKSVEVDLHPWYGYGVATIRLPKTSKANIQLTLSERKLVQTEQNMNVVAGEKIVLTTDGSIQQIDDVQGCFASNNILKNSISAECSQIEGHYVVMALVRTNVPYWKVWKLTITNPEQRRLSGLKNLRSIDNNATWKPVNILSATNGDIRTIFQQNYASPRPATCSVRIGRDGYQAWTMAIWGMTPPAIGLENALAKPSLQNGSLLKDGLVVTPQGVPFVAPLPERNVAFTSLWDNWPDRVTVPVGQSADAVWLLIAGSTHPLQGRIANSVVHFLYADGVEECLDLIPPLNFRSICRWGGSDYNLERDAFALGDNPPLMVDLGLNCRAMLYGWRLRKGVKLSQVTLEAMSQEVVVGLMGVSLMNPEK